MAFAQANRGLRHLMQLQRVQHDRCNDWPEMTPLLMKQFAPQSASKTNQVCIYVRMPHSPKSKIPIIVARHICLLLAGILH